MSAGPHFKTIGGEKASGRKKEPGSENQALMMIRKEDMGFALVGLSKLAGRRTAAGISCPDSVKERKDGEGFVD